MSSVPHPCSLVSMLYSLPIKLIIDFYCAGNSTVNVALLGVRLLIESTILFCLVN